MMGIDEFCLLKPIITMGFSLSFYGKKEDKKMKQIIFIKTKDSYLNELIELVQKQSFKVKEGDCSIGVCLDVNKKIMSPQNVVCMCGFSRFDNRPLLAKEVIENFEEIVINKNELLLNKLYEISKKDLSRPIGGFLR